MKETVFKVGLLLSILLITVMVGVLYALAPMLGSAYLRMFENIDNLPRLTGEFALPLLRASTSAGLERSADMLWWVGVFWLLAFVLPWLILIWSWRATTPHEGLARWVIGMSIYLPLYGISLAAIFSGLIVAMAPL